ncbi:Hypothetical protein FKW44_013879 [Caligus rogercresseyi]|uniref:Uncharacterized protein n=1 Tax=Caligus rogercresseyi TaxID=217165 RepID=A0A7T8GY82_CALRO|nr:Hypothetical protein FKW44_013879 [Caligus rogercresseyi]
MVISKYDEKTKMPQTGKHPGGEASNSSPSPNQLRERLPLSECLVPYLGIMQRNKQQQRLPRPEPIYTQQFYKPIRQAIPLPAGWMDSPMESIPGPATLPSGATATFPTEPIIHSRVPARQNVSLLLGRIAREIADLTASLQV